MEEDHEVYGGEIPVKGELEGDIDPQHADVDMYAAEEDAFKVLLLSSLYNYATWKR